MLRELMRLWPRVRGQGWEKAKIHEQLHVPDDIERNGAPQGSHTGPTEHNHIRLVKRPAKGTQQRAEVFDRQLGQRVSDAYIVDMAYQRMATPYDQHPLASSSLVQIFTGCHYKLPKDGSLLKVILCDPILADENLQRKSILALKWLISSYSTMRPCQSLHIH